MNSERISLENRVKELEDELKSVKQEVKNLQLAVEQSVLEERVGLDERRSKDQREEDLKRLMDENDDEGERNDE